MTITVNTNFIQSLYLNVLQRVGTQTEINTWVDSANAGMTASTMVNTFITSIEGRRTESIIRLYDAFFNRAPDSDGLYFWTNALNSGVSLRTIAVGFGNSPEFTSRFVNFSTADFVETIYNNLYERASDPEGKTFWISQVDSGAINRTDVALFFAESNEALSSSGAPTRFADSYLVLPASGNHEPSTADVNSLASSTLSEAIDQRITSFDPLQDAAQIAAEAAEVAAAAAAAAAAVAAAALGSASEAAAAAAAAAAKATADALALAAAEAITAKAIADAAALAAATAAAAAAAAAAASVTGSIYTLTTGADTILGTVNADLFTSSYDAVPATDTLSGADILTGGDGIDTLLINHFIDVAITPPDALWTGITGIEKVTLNTTGDGAQTITTGSAFNAAFTALGITLTTTTSGAGAININMAAFTGAATINTTSLAGAQTIITGSGVTSVDAESAAGALTIYGVGLSSVNALTTGAGPQTIGDAFTGGGNLISVVANSNEGAQTITSTSDAAVTITSTSILGSINTISALGTGTHTITSGAGNDSITGGTGVDTITAGAGSNVFDFGAAGSIIGASLDVITDFKAAGSSNSVKFGLGSTSLVAVDTSTLVAGSNVNTTAGGLVTFDAADNTLALKTAAIQADIELDVAGAVAMFVDGGNTYLYYAGTAADNADDQLIQLTGIIDMTTITAGATVQIA